MTNDYESGKPHSRWRRGVFLKTIPLVLFFLLPLLAQSQEVSIGTGVSTQIYPLGNFYGFERSSSIYLSTEINQIGTINAVDWYANTAGLGSRPIKIYLKEVTATEHPSSMGSWATEISGATLVYDGAVSPIAGWNKFYLHTPFNYTGGNLKVMVEANYGGNGNGQGISGNSIRYSIASNKHAWWRADTNPPTGNGTRNGNRPNIILDYNTPPPSCTGTPNGGSVAINPSSGAGRGIGLNATGFETGRGISGVWETSINGAAWFPQTLTEPTLSVNLPEGVQQGDTWKFRYALKCSFSDSTGYSNEVTYTVDYTNCIPTTTGNTGHIINFVANGGGSQVINNTASGPGQTSGYSNFNTQIVDVTPTTNMTYSVKMTGSNSSGVKIWIDWNDDGNFDSSEIVYQSTTSKNLHEGSILIPVNAIEGNKRMRVGAASSTAAGPNGPCYHNGNGEFEDYTINVIPLPICSGTPEGGTASLNPTTGNPGSTFTVTTTGATIADGIEYQWQKNVGGWADIAGATSTTSTITAETGAVGTATNYRLKITCTNSGSTAYSNEVTHTLALVYCTPTTTGGEYLSNIQAESSVDDILYNVSSQPTNPVKGYDDRSGSINLQTVPGDVVEVNTLYVGGSNTVKVWVDWNKNGVFDINELMDDGYVSSATTVNELSFNVPSDAPLGEYRVRVRGRWSTTAFDSCDVITYGSAVDFTLSVVAPPSCQKPTVLNASNITAASAQLSWTENNSATSWKIEYGPTGFAQGTGTVITVTSNPYTLSGLTANTAYQFYVSSICGVGDESTWTGPLSFKTACEPSQIPFFEGFESGYAQGQVVDGCWSQENISGTETWEANNTLTDYNRTRRTGDWNAYLRYANEDWLFYALDLTANTNYVFTVYARQDATSGATLALAYGSSALASAMTIIKTQNITNGNYQEVSEIFSVPSSGTYYIGIKGETNFSPWYLSIDDISVDLAPSCLAPTDLTLDNVTSNSVTVSWTPGGNETEWSVAYGLAGWDANNDAPIYYTNVTSSEVTFTNLDPNTSYDIYLLALCGDGEISSIVGPLTFATSCAPLSVPYFEDFESITYPALPSCTSTEVIAGNAWNTTGNGDGYPFTSRPSGFTGNSLIYRYHSSGSANSWFFTGGIELEAGKTYQIAYKYGNNSASYVEKLKVAYGSSATAAAMTQTLANYPNISEALMHEDEISFTIATDGVYYFGFQSYSGGNQYYMYIDDISIDEVQPAGYVYENGAWTPENPSGVATATDNITIVDGSTTLANITGNNVTINSGASLDVTGILNVHGDLTINGNLTFKSSATGNGELGVINGTITGNATVEHHMRDRRSYRMVSPAVTTSTSIRTNWQEGGATPVGYGTHITGSTTGANGFDATQTGNASMWTVDMAAQQFVPVTNTNVDNLEAGKAYLMFIRGDRNVDLNSNDSHSATTLRATGQLHKGDKVQTFTSPAAGAFIMVGNPYQSAVNVNTLATTNATNINSGHYYTYDVGQGDHGGYVTVSLPSGINGASSPVNQYLQAGQAAQFATLSAGASSVTFTEGVKAPGNFAFNNAGGNGFGEENMINVQLFTAANFANGGRTHDAVTLMFDDSYSNAITAADAVKPMNFRENLGVESNGTYLSIEKREMPIASEVYQLFTSGYTHNSYTFNVEVNGLSNHIFYLDDSYTGSSRLLSAGETAYHFEVDSNEESRVADRFSIRVESRLGVEENVLSGIRLFPNPINAETFYIHAPKLNGEQVEVSIADLTGRQIFNSNLSCTSSKITVNVNETLASGVYLVTVKFAGEAQTYRLVRE